MAFDFDRYRPELPVTEASVCLNHSAVCLLPGWVRNAVCGLVEEVRPCGAEHSNRRLHAYQTTRLAAGRLLSPEVGRIAFTKNTSETISFVANRLDWQTGDEVVSVASEFSANYPRKIQETRGVRL